MDLKQFDIVDTPYPNTQISDSSDSEEDVQSPQNLLNAEHKFYSSMENNERNAKVKHLAQFYTKYWCSLKHNFVIAKFVLSISPTQFGNEFDLSIAGVFS